MPAVKKDFERPRPYDLAWKQLQQLYKNKSIGLEVV
jgi:hypothetical protein